MNEWSVQMASSSNSKDMISAWNLVFSSAPAMALKCALLLKIPDIISRAGAGADGIAALSIADIAAHMEKPPDMDSLSRILRYLSTIGVFAEMEIKGEMVYALTPMTKTYFLTEGNPANLAAFHLFINDQANQAAWHCLQESAVGGRHAFQIAHGGTDIWDYASRDACYNRLLNDGMLSQTSVLMKDILADYEGFKDVSTLVDIGGGVGGALKEIVAAHPHIHAINFDLPHVVANAPHIPGIQHVAGNMFESIPFGDAFFLKHVLHDWDDASCVKILKNCYQALPDRGKLILAEGVMEVGQHSYQPLQLLDLTVFALTNGGKERSQHQWMELLGKAGFHGFHVRRIIGREENVLKIIEAIKVSK